MDFCGSCDVHPALANPADIEGRSEGADEEARRVYRARFQPLYLWYRWMRGDRNVSAYEIGEKEYRDTAFTLEI